MKGEKRTVLRLHPRLAPVKVAVLPLSKKDELVPLTAEVESILRPYLQIDTDTAGAIGRRYRRQDEVGTPYCVTIDFDSLEDHAVTVRERDSMEQERIPVKAICSTTSDRGSIEGKRLIAMDDYYELLDVAPDAERDDIRAAYREPARRALAADDDDNNRAEIAKLNRAWNVLSDPAQRERYDDRLAEYRETDDDGDYEDEDDDDDGDDGGARRGAASAFEGAADARASNAPRSAEARLERKPTITVPEGLTQASTRSRLSALGFDVAVLVLVAGLVYFVGLKLIDNHFPGQQKLGRDLQDQQNDVKKEVNDDRKRASARRRCRRGGEDAQGQRGGAGREGQGRGGARPRRRRTRSGSTRSRSASTTINRRLSPWIYMVLASRAVPRAPVSRAEHGHHRPDPREEAPPDPGRASRRIDPGLVDGARALRAAPAHRGAPGPAPQRRDHSVS